MGNVKTKNKAHSKRALTLDDIKLAVALDLKLNGYVHITFDRPILVHGRKEKIHIHAEDDLGISYAVICISSPAKLDPNSIIDAVSAIQAEIGVEGEVAVAIPISLLDKAKDLFGLTRQMFMVDGELRVWTSTSPRSVADLIKAKMPMREQLHTHRAADSAGNQAALFSAYSACYVV
ncbi:MAG: hypothetical protein ACPLKZ_01640 [Candidatus Bathyarchaeales archaeon]